MRVIPTCTVVLSLCCYLDYRRRLSTLLPCLLLLASTATAIEILPGIAVGCFLLQLLWASLQKIRRQVQICRADADAPVCAGFANSCLRSRPVILSVLNRMHYGHYRYL